MSDSTEMTREELCVYYTRRQLWTEFRAAQAKEMAARRAISALESKCEHRLTGERETDHHGTRWVYCKICDKDISHVAGT